MNNAYLLEGLESGPKTLEILLNRIPEEAMDRPTHPDRFTPREVAAHLADWEPRLRGRIQTALDHPDAEVPVWDEGELAEENRYGESDWRKELDRFRSERAETIRLLKSLKPEEFGRTFRHPERGLMKIEDQAAFFLGHDLYHASQLSSVAS